jgi:hypothetical protein
MMTQYAVSYRSVVNMSPQTYDLWHRKRTYHDVCSAVLGCVSTSAGEHIKVLELVAKHSNLYGLKFCGCTSKDVFDLVWGNVGKGLSKSSKVVYC